MKGSAGERRRNISSLLIINTLKRWRARSSFHIQIIAIRTSQDVFYCANNASESSLNVHDSLEFCYSFKQFSSFKCQLSFYCSHPLLNRRRCFCWLLHRLHHARDNHRRCSWIPITNFIADRDNFSLDRVSLVNQIVMQYYRGWQGLRRTRCMFIRRTNCKLISLLRVD